MKNQVHKIAELFPKLQNYFSPKVIGEVNDVFIKVVKTLGDVLPWHTHDHEDELFYIVKGSLVMQQRDEDDFILSQGELYIVPQGVEHRMYSDQECWILLVENKATAHTGSVKTGITKSIDEQM